LIKQTLLVIYTYTETLCIALLIEMFHGALTSSGFVLYLTRKYLQA